MTKVLLVSTPDAPSGNYQQALTELLDSGALADLPKGGAYRLAVIHDDDCSIFSGGRCSCEPAFALRHLEELL